MLKKIIKTFKVFITRRIVLTFDKVDFIHTHLSWKRLKNWFLAEISYAIKSDRVWAYPTHLQLEPSNICNLSCPVCHSVTDNKPKGLLKLDDFKKLMGEIGDYLLFLHFWGWGEPFMNKDFLSMVRIAKDKGMKIITSTNGHYFENEHDIDLLIDSGLDVLIFAMDGIDSETYEKYRHKGDFNKVKKGLGLLLKRRKERGVSTPRINLRMLVTRENEDQVPQMRKFAEETGVDIFSLKTVFSFDNKAKGEELVPRDPAYHRFEYDKDGKPVRKENPCRKLWNHPSVYRDGSVVICDYHTGEELSMGNIFDDSGMSFKDIWSREEYRRIRNRFLKGELSGLRCEECALNYADVDRFVSHAFTANKA